jgi:hypothetical protein
LSAATEINDHRTGTTCFKEWKSGSLEFLYTRFDFEADQRQASAHKSIFLASHFYNNQVKIHHPGCFENGL